MNVAKMRIFKYMCGMTGLNKIKNEYVRRCLGVMNTSEEKEKRVIEMVWTFCEKANNDEIIKKMGQIKEKSGKE